MYAFLMLYFFYKHDMSFVRLYGDNIQNYVEPYDTLMINDVTF